ncbi:MAG: hypothetical protein AB7O21_17565 [Gammaproteobacteria bacterium]
MQIPTLTVPATSEEGSRSRVIAPGVTEQLYRWGRIFAGTRAALTALDLLGPGMCPGDPGQRKTVARVRVDGRNIEVRRTSRLRLEVRVPHSATEAALYRSWVEERRAREEAHDEVLRLPTDERSFRRRMLNEMEGLRERLQVLLAASHGGFRFDDEVNCAAREHMRSLMQVVARAPVQFCQAARWGEAKLIRARHPAMTPAITAAGAESGIALLSNVRPWRKHPSDTPTDALPDPD